MDIPEAILDKLDIVYEDDGKTPKAVKVKVLNEMCKHCDRELEKPQRFLSNFCVHPHRHVKQKCLNCAKYLNPRNGKFECDIHQITHIIQHDKSKG